MADETLRNMAEEKGIQTDSADGGHSDESQATAMVRLARESGAEFWHTPDHDTYASVPFGDHTETVRLDGKAARLWLRQLFYDHAGKTPGAQAAQDALQHLQGLADLEGPEHRAHVRFARHGDALYVDMCNPQWRAVEVTAEGWQVVNNSPVKFRRTRGMLPLPDPEEGGSLEALEPFVNFATAHDFRLALSWLVAAVMPEGPYPVLALYGEQGSAKSTTARILRALCDPNQADIRAEPREPRDLAVAASNSRVVALDNLSHVRDWLSDALCRLSTGGGFATRQLYSDGDEVIFSAQRPVILTGISELATRGDLLDRAIVSNCPRIPEGRYRDDAEFWAEFEQARPRLLGALLDAVSCVLRDRDNVRPPKLPRMAAFARTAAAAAPPLGWTADEFLAAYSRNRSGANIAALEASPVPPALLEFMQGRGTWTGTAGELLKVLEPAVPDAIKRQRAWPSSPRALSGDLRRLAPNLHRAGLDIAFPDETGGSRRDGRRYEITERSEPVRESPSPSSPASPSNVEAARDGEGGAAHGDGHDGDGWGLASPESHVSAASGDDGDDGDAELSLHPVESGASGLFVPWEDEA